MILLLVAVLLLVAAVVALLVVVLRRLDTDPVERVMDRRVRKPWLVSLKSGEAFKGMLVDHDDACLVLSHADHFADPHSSVPVDGEVVLLLSDVKYAQRL